MLPRGWRFKVEVLALAGATTADWEYCVEVAGESAGGGSRKQIAPDRMFDYMIGVAWNVLGARSGINPSAVEPHYLTPERAAAAEAERLAAENAQRAARTANERIRAERAAKESEYLHRVREEILVVRPFSKSDLARAQITGVYPKRKVHRGLDGCGLSRQYTEEANPESVASRADLCGSCFPDPRR